MRVHLNLAPSPSWFQNRARNFQTQELSTAKNPRPQARLSLHANFPSWVKKDRSSSSWWVKFTHAPVRMFAEDLPPTIFSNHRASNPTDRPRAHHWLQMLALPTHPRQRHTSMRCERSQRDRLESHSTPCPWFPKRLCVASRRPQQWERTNSGSPVLVSC